MPQSTLHPKAHKAVAALVGRNLLSTRDVLDLLVNLDTDTQSRVIFAIERIDYALTTGTVIPSKLGREVMAPA